jgi:hypothetical protein
MIRKTYDLSEKDFTVVKDTNLETVFEININDYRIRIIDGVNNNKRSNLVMWGTKYSWREQARVRTFSDACLIAQRYRTQINKLTKKS